MFYKVTYIASQWQFRWMEDV